MNGQLDDLQVQARYRRQKHDLYRAKIYGPRPTSPDRLREVERTAQAAEARLIPYAQRKSRGRRDAARGGRDDARPPV